MFEMLMGILVGYYFGKGELGTALLLALVVFILERLWGYMTQPEV